MNKIKYFLLALLFVGCSQDAQVSGLETATLPDIGVDSPDSPDELDPDVGPPDTTPPSIEIKSHLGGEFLTFNLDGKFKVSGLCDEEGEEVTFTEGLGSVICDGESFEGLLDVSSLPEGEFDLVASLSDSAGNTATTDPINVVKGTAFVSEWRIEPENLTLVLPLKEDNSYIFQVDWGDGTPPQKVDSYDHQNSSHSYALSGTYTVTISGLMEAFGSNLQDAPYKTQLLRVTSLGHVGWKDLSYAFYNANNLTDVLGGNTSMVKTMRGMFAYTKLAEPDTGEWDVSKVSDMSRMFLMAESAEPDTENWDVTSVEIMAYMFNRAYKANPVTTYWNTSNVRSMYQMFLWNEIANPNTANWDTSSVVNMREMFRGARSATPNTSNWDTASVKTMQLMFYNATSANPDTSNWNTSSVSNMTQIFHKATNANPDLSSWDFSSVTKMSSVIRQSGISNKRYSDFLVNLHGQGVSLPLVMYSPAQYQTQAVGARDGLISSGWTFEDAGAE